MSADTPSVKGSIFTSVAEDLKAALADGRLSRDDLEAALGPKDRDLLDSVVTAVSWVRVDAYGRMLDLLAKLEGGGRRDAYLRDRGARAAERLLSGTYESFDPGPGGWGRHAGELMTNIAKVLYNFTSWSLHELESGGWEIRADDAFDFPDAAAHTAHGFLNWVLQRGSEGRFTVTLERSAPDRIVYRIEANG